MKPSQKGQANIVLVVAIALALALGGLAGYFGVFEGTAELSPDSMAGWEAYTNTQLGFSLKFPPSWTGYSVTSVSGQGYNKVDFHLPTAEVGWGGDHVLFVITHCTLSRFNEDPANEPGVCTGSEIARNDNYIFTVNRSQVAPPADLGAANQDIEAILSTFELTTPAPTAGWKTYTNTEFGFEVKLPPNWSGYVVWTGPEHPGATGWVDILYNANAQVPGQAVRFIIYTPAQWNTELTYDQPHPIELGRSDIYVITTPFRFEYQGLPGEADIQSILSTFRFTK